MAKRTSSLTPWMRRSAKPRKVSKRWTRDSPTSIQARGRLRPWLRRVGPTEVILTTLTPRPLASNSNSQALRAPPRAVMLWLPRRKTSFQFSRLISFDNNSRRRPIIITNLRNQLWYHQHRVSEIYHLTDQLNIIMVEARRSEPHQVIFRVAGRRS